MEADQLAPLERLSHEELHKIANLLDPRELSSLGRCSKTLHAATQSPEAWRGALAAVGAAEPLNDGCADPRRVSHKLQLLVMYIDLL